VVVSDEKEQQEKVFYLYQHIKTKNWFVFYQPFDGCLGCVRWSKTLWNAFQKQVGVANPRGMNDAYVRRFEVEREVVEEMEEKMGAYKKAAVEEE
jgi:hypothetical protein